MKNLLLIILIFCTVGTYAQECGFSVMHQRLMDKDPAFKAKVQAMNADIAAKHNNNMQSLVTTSVAQGTVYEIPVVVHVIHTGGSIGSQYNPTDSLIEATLDYVNETYQATYSGYPDSSSGGTYFPIKFVLAKRDESCNSTTAINRVDYSSSSTYVNYGVNIYNTNGVDETVVKALSRWNNRSYYNIWIVNKLDNNNGTSGTFTGAYAYFPGTSGDIDGTVALASQFAPGNYTLPHELGHAFALYHTFEGDGTGSTCPTNTSCTTQGDLVCDTEPHVRNLGYCASGTTNSCVSATYDDKVAKNFMNYCTCPDRFTAGQQERFIAALKAYRSGLLSSMATMDTSLSVIAANCIPSTTSANLNIGAHMGPIYVKFNDLENATGGTDEDNYDYYDYSCQMRANVIAGETYKLKIATYQNAQVKAVWIDFDNNGKFKSGEIVAAFYYSNYGTAADTDWHSTNITIPSSAVTCTPLRMRVMTEYAANTLPANGCATLQYGQTEDYAVYIKPASAATTAVVSSHPICTGGGNTIFELETTGTFTNPTYQWYKNGATVGTDSVLYPASGLVTGDYVQVKLNYTDACYDDSIFTDVYTVTTQTDTNTWVGYDNTTYGDKDNWSCGTKPVASETVIVDGNRMVYAPGLNNIDRYSKNIWLLNGAYVAFDSLLELTGNITIDDNSTLDLSNGKLILNGSSAQTMTFGDTADNVVVAQTFELDNTAGASFGTYGTLKIDSVYIPTSGTLTSNGKLRLTSDASGSAYIDQGSSSGGYISGNVIAEKYVPGKRAFRFVAHPFSSSIGLSELTDDIDITGSGGSTNGFTTTSSNNPSAFWFDVSNADTSTTGSNPGWTAFTSTNGSGANSWDQYELVRLFVRGAIGEGLSGSSYTPSDVTWEYAGTVNQGDQVITLTKGSNSDFVGCGNPFPSGVQMNTIARGSNVGANYYAWDATSGAAGAYLTNPWSMSYVLPAYASFFTTVSANSNNTLTIEEADKAGNSNALFKHTGNDYWVELSISDSTTHWDRLLIGFDNNGMSVQDQLDGKKLYNPGLDFFTLSKDAVRLAVDVRPYNDGEVIPLGLTAYNRYNKYVIKTGMFDVPVGTKLYLRDKYLNKSEELKPGFEYWFDVTSDSLSQGNNRFQINMIGKPSGLTEINNTIPEMQLIPNPADKEVKVAFKAMEGKVQVRLMSLTGQVVYYKELQDGTGSVTIQLDNIPAGVYMVSLKGNNRTFNQKLVKE